MPRATSILVAHGDETVRVELTQALHDAGYECIDASQGEEALRFVAGLNPRLVVLEADLPAIPALELFNRLQATGLELPPFLILASDPDAASQHRPAESVFFVPAAPLDPEDLVRRVRLFTLSGEIGGELDDRLEALYGDLSRSPLAPLLDLLRKHVITGCLRLKEANDAGLWLEEGDVVNAWWDGLSGRKAFNRVVDLRRGGFQLTLQAVEVERAIDIDLGTLMGQAVAERLALVDALEALPSMEATPRVQLVDGFFSIEFTAVEQRVISRAQEASTLRELLDRVPAPDIEVAHAVRSLMGRGILELTEPQNRVRVVTDSTSDLQPAEARRLGVTVLPVTILFGTEVFKDGVDLQPEEFQRKVRATRVLPTTNPVTRGEFLEAYRRVVPGADVLSIHPSTEISGTHANAQAALRDGADELRALRQQEQPGSDPRILTVSTGQSSGSLGMLVVLATRLLARGIPLEEAARRLAELGQRMRTVLLVRSLEFLERSGDVRSGSSKAASDELWPILELVGGGLRPVDQAPRGPDAVTRLVDQLVTGVDPTKPVMVTLVHASAPALSGVLRAELERRTKLAELSERQMGPAVTCHVGPGAVGAGLLQPTDEELELLAPEPT